MLLLTALLWASGACAQWIKPTNGLALPLDAPLDIELVLPDQALGYQAHIPRPSGLSPLGDALGAETMRHQEDKHLRPALARLNAAMTHDHRADALTAAIRREIEGTGKIKIGELRVHRGVAVADLPRGDPDSRVLLLIARYDMEAGFMALAVSLDARYGPRSEVLALDRKPKLVFAQNIASRQPRVMHSGKSGGLFGWMQVAAQDWETTGPTAISAHIDAGLQDVAAMLAYELQRKPRFGRIPGKQYAVETTYGVVETRIGDRAWLRLRNGRLSSLPLSAVDAP
ncbi:MAG: hypothetical protein E6Q88_05925 [Lysobacteraceae bacterium]|nr:MAG: hypothetical protein E6Q88_05925 [Xanthomonadaceae bacterium]